MGKKTTVRIVNSQHDGSHDMAFWDFSRERETVLLRDWNPRAKSLAEWRRQSKFDVFRTLDKARDKYPDRPAFLLSREMMRSAEGCAAPSDKVRRRGVPLPHAAHCAGIS